MKYIQIANLTSQKFTVSLVEDNKGVVTLRIGAKKDAQKVEPKKRVYPFIKKRTK